jgi:hypothetical protein
MSAWTVESSPFGGGLTLCVQIVNCVTSVSVVGIGIVHEREVYRF